MLMDYISVEMISKIAVSLAILIVAIIGTTILNAFIGGLKKKALAMVKEKGDDHFYAMDTQLTMVRRLIVAGIFFLTLVLIMMQYDTMRTVGTGLLASAGVLSLVVGMAAQNTFSNVVAGISIAFSQPVRLNDAVIFENDFGWIEEISLMHTVIKTWDNRRIVVPNNVLANRVIQNWTMKDPTLIGVVMIYVDYHCDVEKVRGWLFEIVKASKYWSGDADPCLHVADFTEKTMVLRALAKANGPGEAWNLRCEVREKLSLKFKEAGLPMPKIRVEQNG